MGQGACTEALSKSGLVLSVIKHRMQLFTEGFTANPVSLNQREKKCMLILKPWLLV